MELVVVGFILKMIDSLLPIGRQNITIGAIKPLTNLEMMSVIAIFMYNNERHLH